MKNAPAILAALFGVTSAAGCYMPHNVTKYTFGYEDTLVAIPENAGGPVGYFDRLRVWQAVHGNMNIGVGEPFDSLREKLEEAKANGDDERAEHYQAELIGFGRTSAEAWGMTPMYTLLVEIDDHLIALAHQHGLGRVIESDYNTEGIDLTDELIARINPPEDTVPDDQSGK